MDCALVKERGVTERYLLGQLSEDERVAFEEHYFECDRCFAELETLREFRAQLAEKGGGTEVWHPPRTTGKLWVLAAGIAATLIAVGIGLMSLLPTTEMRPELIELAQFQPPRYEPVRLRGAADEVQQRFRIAMEFYSAGDYVSAIPGLEEAANLDPNAPNISFFLGASYLLADRISDGINTFESTIALGDTVFLEEAHLLLAKAHVHRGALGAARAELEAVIGLDGDFAPEAQVILDEFSEEVPSAK